MLVPSESTRTSLEKKQKEYATQLPGTPGERWLQKRGLTIETAQFFGLGYVDTAMRGDNIHMGRLVIPYFTRSGVVALRSSSIEDSSGNRPEPKYMPWTHGDVNRPYNTNALSGSHEEVYICEGEGDTWIAHQMGLYAVGIPGVKNWKSEFRPLFRYRKVTVLADNDDEGQGYEFGKHVSQQVGGATIILMPRGDDLTSFYVESGEDVVRKHILGELDNE